MRGKSDIIYNPSGGKAGEQQGQLVRFSNYVQLRAKSRKIDAAVAVPTGS